jgi:hypothetical protein
MPVRKTTFDTTASALLISLGHRNQLGRTVEDIAWIVQVEHHRTEAGVDVWLTVHTVEDRAGDTVVDHQPAERCTNRRCSADLGLLLPPLGRHYAEQNQARRRRTTL